MQKPVDDVTQFHTVDQTTNPAFFTQFMETSHARQTAARRYQQEMIARLELSVGTTVLDDVSVPSRIALSVLYFGLAAVLVLGMSISHGLIR